MEYTLSCGCKFKQFDSKIKSIDGLPSIEIDYYNLPNCNNVWPMLKEGKTKGVFQLESELGRSWCQKVEPWNIDDLSALTAIIRPGVLESIVDGKSLTQKFADRHTGREDVIPIHPALENILQHTEQILVYQEQIMRICNEIAGMSLGDSDGVRKAVGKKNAKDLHQYKDMFVNGAIQKQLVDENTARLLFDIIEKSGRYSFNASHSYSYGYISYWTAYVKQHFPLHFFCSYLEHAKEKIDTFEEIKGLILEMEKFDLNLTPPRLSDIILNSEGSFSISNDSVNFGLLSIKSLGESHIKGLYSKIREKQIKLGKKIENFTWLEFMCEISMLVSKTVIDNLILVGATPDLSVSRKRKALEFALFQKMTDRDLEWISQNYSSFSSLKEVLEKYSTVERKLGGPATQKKRESCQDMVKVLTDSAYNLEDHPEWIVANERKLLGISMTYNIMEAKKIVSDYTCSDFLLGKNGKIEIAAEVSSLRETVIKNGKSVGKKMAFLNFRDTTGNINAVCFAEVYEKNTSILFEGNTVLVSGFRSKKDDKTLTVTNVKQI